MLSRPTETSASPSLREAMRQLAGGVAIITVGTGERRTGFTATSVTSLTLDPPCLLVCINRKVSAWPLIRDEQRFCVNVLADRHQTIAARFAGAGGVKGAARYEGGTWLEGANGTPVLADALTAIECDLEDAIERHSHMILIGAVRTIKLDAPGTPLLYSLGGYGRFQQM